MVYWILNICRLILWTAGYIIKALVSSWILIRSTVYPYLQKLDMLLTAKHGYGISTAIISMPQWGEGNSILMPEFFPVILTRNQALTNILIPLPRFFSEGIIWSFLRTDATTWRMKLTLPMAYNWVHRQDTLSQQFSKTIVIIHSFTGKPAITHQM